MAATRIWMPYCGAAPVPGELLARWNLDPAVLGMLALFAGFCLVSRRLDPTERRWGLGAAGLLALLFVSPFCALTSALFSARVVHHLALTAVAAPMLARAFAWRAPGGVAAWTAGHALVFWFWHSPPAYAQALPSDLVYWAMQASLLGSAVGLWAAVRRAPVPAGIAALLATMVQMGLLGALITFAGAPLYAPHLLTTFAWGLSPREDQQLAGLIMWAPGSALYLGAALLLLGRWFAREGQAVPAP
jgi:putative membrane protein